MNTRNPEVAEDDGMLAAEFSLGVMQGAARDSFAIRMSEDPALAAAVRQWDEHFVNFAGEVASVAPPVRVETALQKRLFGAETSRERVSLWSSLGFWRGLAMASLVGVVALGAWNLRPVPEPGAALVAQVAGDSNAVKLVAYYDADTGALRLNRTEGEAAAGRSLELWLIAGQDAPVSLGVLPAEANGRIVVPETLRGKLAKGTLAISDEPLGGSTTGAPTGAVLATGTLTTV